MPKGLLGLFAAVVLGLILVTSCGGDDNSGATADPGGFNDADVQFATDMIPHHAQALEMVNLAITRQLSPDVQALANDIMAAQTPEVEQMVAWLREWDQPVPSTSLDHGGGHDMADMDMPGMASMDQMAALDAARGEEFERMFLTMMIEHHKGAIQMAQDELENGQNAEAKQLAQDIIDAQQREIERMSQLLDAK